MGFFRRVKEDPVYNLPEELTGGFVQPLSQRLVKVDIGSKLVVQKGWNAVIVAKDRPLDVFEAGENKLSIPNIPKTTAKLALDKSRVIHRHGRPEIIFPKGFMCDIYFVNMGEFSDQQWQTRNLCLKDKKYGRFFVELSGNYSFKCENTALAIHLFLLERAFIKVGYAQRKLQQYVNDFVSEMLKWMRPPSPEIISDKEKMSELIKTHLNEKFKRYGISITELAVLETNFDKHVASLIGENKAKLIRFDDDRSYKPSTNDILDNVDFDDELVIVGATKRQEEKALLKEKISLNRKSKSDETKSSNISSAPTLVEEMPKLEQKEIKNTKVKRHCPKCGKVCKDTDSICECGCNLD